MTKTECFSRTSYAAITTSIGTPNSTGQRCAYRAPATNENEQLAIYALCSFFRFDAYLTSHRQRASRMLRLLRDGHWFSRSS